MSFNDEVLLWLNEFVSPQCSFLHFENDGWRYKKKCCHFTAVQGPDFSAHLYFEMYIQCQLSNSPLQNVLIFFFNFASVIFFHLWFYIQRTKFILGESVSIVMNFIFKILQTRILRNQSVFVVIHFICGKTCNNIILKHYLRVML